MHEVNLRGMDLNLLVILRVLLETRHMTRAAGRLNMSQSAVSRALQRLRAMFDDPLLVRTQLGYELSPRAARLRPLLQQTLASVENMIAQPAFTPHASRDVVRFYGPDLEIISFLPRLAAAMEREAPFMQIDIRSEPRDHFELLAAGDVHFTFTGMTPPHGDDQYHQAFLTESPFVCLMRQGHPLSQAPLSLDAYLAASHGQVVITGRMPGQIDEALAALGTRRNITLRLASFASIAFFCERTDLIFSLPDIIARQIAQGRALHYQPMPDALRLRSLRSYLYWHERDHTNPMCQWVRDILLQTSPHT